MKATNVTALNGYKINVSFENGVSGTIDLTDMLQKGIFRQLLDEAAFKKIYIDGSAVAWSDELEIDADNICAEILNTPPFELLHKPL
jgi:hypothetical protein